MKSITAAFAGHLAQTVTSLATIWRITRQDGRSFFMTDHDVDIVYDGNTYKAETGYTRTSVQNNSTMAVDNLDIMGLFDSDEISEEEIRAGLFDYAEIRIAVVNWQDLSQGELKVRRGRLGECVLTPKGWFQAEMRGMTQNLSMNLLQLYQAECRADLGDSKCQVPIRPPIRQAETVYQVGTIVRVPTDGTVTDLIDGEPIEEAYENRLYRVVSAGITDPTLPVFDTTVGEITVESGNHATALLTLTGNPADGQTFTVDGKVYTMQTTLTDVDGNIQLGNNILQTHANILAAVTLGPGAGTAYAASMTPHPTVDFEQGPSAFSIRLIAQVFGAAGNTITLAENLANAAFDGPTMSGGYDGVQWIAQEAWTRHGEIVTVHAPDDYTVAITDPAAVDGWYNGGGLVFESGLNKGWAIEVRDWTQATSRLTVFLNAPFPVEVGDKFRVYPGCDKRSETCSAKFANILNFRGEPFVPGNDEVTYYPDAQ